MTLPSYRITAFHTNSIQSIYFSKAVHNIHSYPTMFSKTSSRSFLLSLLAVITPFTSAYWKGFNLGANLASTGACKSQADWQKDFTTMQSLPGYFSSARLYASSDCNTLANVSLSTPSKRTWRGIRLMIFFTGRSGCPRNRHQTPRRCVGHRLNSLFRRKSRPPVCPRSIWS